MPEHQFKAVYFKTPTWCDLCGKFIKGVLQEQGEKCVICGYSIHFKCRATALEDQCSGSKKEQDRKRSIKVRGGVF